MLPPHLLDNLALLFGMNSMKPFSICIGDDGGSYCLVLCTTTMTVSMNKRNENVYKNIGNIGS